MVCVSSSIQFKDDCDRIDKSSQINVLLQDKATQRLSLDDKDDGVQDDYEDDEDDHQKG